MDNLTAIEDDDSFGTAYEDPIGEADFYRNYAKFHFGVQLLIQYVWSPIILCSEIFLLYVLLRFKKLRIRRNMYLLNCLCSDILTKSLVILDFFLVKTETFNERSLSTICLFIEYHNLQHPCYFLVVVLLALDSVLESYFPEKLRKLERYWGYFMMFVYSIFIITFVIRGSKCFDKTQFWFNNKAYLIRYVVFSITVVSLITLNIIQNCCIKKSLIGVSLANIILFLYVPIFLYNLILQFTQVHRIIIHFLYYTEFLAEMLAMGHPLFVIYFLGRREQNFKIAYDICLRRCRRIENNDSMGGIDNVANTSLEDV